MTEKNPHFPDAVTAEELKPGMRLAYEGRKWPRSLLTIVRLTEKHVIVRHDGWDIDYEWYLSDIGAGPSAIYDHTGGWNQWNHLSHLRSGEV